MNEMNCGRKMEEFEEQARIRQQNREKARQANEESKRQFEEHMRFLRERRFGSDEDIDEYGGVFRERMAREQAEQDRLMLERLQAMALADLSQREMQKEFGRICQPIDEQQSAVNSAEGLLINWLNRFSDKAGFSDGVTVSQYNSTFGSRQKFRLIVNVSNSRHRYSERRSLPCTTRCKRPRSPLHTRTGSLLSL